MNIFPDSWGFYQTKYHLSNQVCILYTVYRDVCQVSYLYRRRMAAGPQGGQTFSQKNIKNPFKKIPESLGLSNYPKRHYGALEKIPESLGGIQIIYPEIQILPI